MQRRQFHIATTIVLAALISCTASRPAIPGPIPTSRDSVVIHIVERDSIVPRIVERDSVVTRVVPRDSIVLRIIPLDSVVPTFRDSTVWRITTRDSVIPVRRDSIVIVLRDSIVLIPRDSTVWSITTRDSTIWRITQRDSIVWNIITRDSIIFRIRDSIVDGAVRTVQETPYITGVFRGTTRIGQIGYTASTTTSWGAVTPESWMAWHPTGPGTMCVNDVTYSSMEAALAGVINPYTGRDLCAPSAHPPELPRVYLDTTMPPTPGSVIPVTAPATSTTRIPIVKDP